MMEPKDPQIKWKMESDPILKRVTYTSDSGHTISRRGYYGIKTGKKGNHYILRNTDGSPLGGEGFHTQLGSAKEEAARLAAQKKNDN